METLRQTIVLRPLTQTATTVCGWSRRPTTIMSGWRLIRRRSEMDDSFSASPGGTRDLVPTSEGLWAGAFVLSSSWCRIGRVRLSTEPRTMGAAGRCDRGSPAPSSAGSHMRSGEGSKRICRLRQRNGPEARPHPPLQSGGRVDAAPSTIQPHPLPY